MLVFESAQPLAKISEFSATSPTFESLKRCLLHAGFTVYEFIRGQASRLPTNQVMFTHEHLRDQKSCTFAVASSMLSTVFAEHAGRPNKGLRHSIWHRNVTFTKQQQKDSLIDAADLLVSPLTPSYGRGVIQKLLHLLTARPTLIYMNRARVCCRITIS